MRYHLFQKFFGKMVKIKKTSFHSTREDTYFLPPLYIDFDCLRIHQYLLKPNSFFIHLCLNVILGIFEYENICGHNLPVNMCRVANFRIKFIYSHDIFICSKLSRKF